MEEKALPASSPLPGAEPVSRRSRSRRGSRRRWGTAVLAPAVGLLLGACTLVNAPTDRPAPETAPPEPPPPEAVTRSYGGHFSVQGTSLPVVLSLVLRGEEVEQARLTVPELDLEATGEGRLRAGRLDLRLRYGSEGCRGDAHIDAALVDEGRRFDGVLRARDCTGSEEGTLMLLLRPGDGSGRSASRLLR